MDEIQTLLLMAAVTGAGRRPVLPSPHFRRVGREARETLQWVAKKDW